MFQDVHVGLKEHVVDNKSLLCSDLMDATYDFGLQILCASIESIKEKSDATVVPVLFLRNICRHIKATAILARNAFAEPCDLTLRAHFESCIGLSYMLKENTARRAAAYRIVDLLDQIRRAKEISPATNEGKRLRTQLQGDRLAKLDNPIYANLPQEIIKLDNLLAELTKEQNCRTAYDEYRKIEKETKNRQYPAWYLVVGRTSIAPEARQPDENAIYVRNSLPPGFEARAWPRRPA